MPEPVPTDEGARVEDLRREGHPQRPAGRPRRRGQDHAPGGHAVHGRSDHAHGHGRGRQHRLRPRSRRATQGHLASRSSMAPVEWDGVEDQRARRARLRRLRRRPAHRDPRRRRGASSSCRRSTASRSRPRSRGSWRSRQACPARSSSTSSTASAPTFEATLDAARVGVRQPGRARSSCRSARSTSSAGSPTCCTRRPTCTRAGRGPRRSDWPDELHAMADPSREKLIEAVAEADDALIEKYLEAGALPEEQIVEGVKAGFARARLAPVICGSAAKAIGDRPAARLHRGGVPLAARSRPGRPCTAKDGAENERTQRPERAARRARVQDGLGPVRRPHHDVPRVLRHGPAGLVGATTRRRAPRSGSASCSRSGARTTRRSPRCRPATSAPSRSCRTRTPATPFARRTTR